VHDEHFARLSDENDPSAKLAVLEYRFIEKQTHGNLVEIHLHTGRYHQIRAQMAACGCPILGDAKYGSVKNFQTSGIALHHGVLEFFHPVCNDRVVFTQEPFF
jgi:23S rRNA pseudouridine1911/1915/1917 synthase